jgi:diguanylate cyclase (GGDEF)-like protein
MKEELSKQELHSLLYTDELTQAHNFRYFREQLPKYLSEAREKNITAGLFVVDIDDFKSINDSYGHLIGDKALEHFVKTISKQLVSGSLVIRYAGDEFVLLIPNVDKPTASILGQDIIRRMQEAPFVDDGTKFTIQCSIGISLFPQDADTLKSLFEKADEALYTAKEKGKSTIVVTPDAGKLLTPRKLNSILESPHIVGRDTFVEFLKIHMSKGGDSQFFPVIMGSEGTGKTCLIRHASRIAHENLDFTLQAKGYPFWQSDIYGAVFSSLVSLFEEERSISDHVYSKLDDKFKLSLRPYIPSWRLKGIDGKEIQRSSDKLILFEALTQAFLILRELGDGAILLDDIDQMDSPSLQFFGSQFGHTKRGKFYFLSALRSPDLATGEEKLLTLLEIMPELTSSKKVHRMFLEPLTTDHLQKLVAKIFDGKTLPQNPAEAILRNSGGTPLFIMEALSALLLENKIKANENDWDLSQVKPTDIPTSLIDMLKARLMRLDKEAVNILKMAAILGERIYPQQLAEIGLIKLHQVLSALNDARKAMLIEEGPNPDEYVFSHRISRSVFYSLVSEEERQQYHVRAAELEQKYAGQDNERIVSRLAYHFHNAGQLEKAAEMYSTLKNQMESVYISRGTRKILQRRIHTVALSKESTIEEEDLATAVMITRTFRSCMQNMRLYPRENENVKMSINQFMNHLVPFLSEKTEALAVSVTPETMLFNGQPIQPHMAEGRLAKDLYLTLSSFGLQGLLFLRGITVDEVVEFLEIFKRLPEEVIGRWDVLMEQFNIAHIFPDRKIFVAVSERKVVIDNTKFFAHSETSDSPIPNSPEPPPQMDETLLEELKALLDQFASEKQELISALRSGGISGKQLQELTHCLNQSDLGMLASSIKSTKIDEVPHFSKSPLTEKAKYTDVKPDNELIKKNENDLTLAFEDLISENSNIRAKAASWLAQQDPFKLAEAGFAFVSTDAPLRFRKLTAELIYKAGPEATGLFLKKLQIGMCTVPQMRVLRVCDAFVGHPVLIPTLRDIIMKGSVDAIPSILNVLKKIPGPQADSLIFEAFMRAPRKIIWDFLPLFGERKMIEVIPILSEYVRLTPKLEKEKNITLQEEICRLFGVMGSADAAEVLISAATIPSIVSLYRTKPDSIRAAATWALIQLPENPQIEEALEKLKNDRAEIIKKAFQITEASAE